MQLASTGCIKPMASVTPIKLIFWRKSVHLTNSFYTWIISTATCFNVNNCTSPVHGICKTTDVCQCHPGYIGNRSINLYYSINITFFSMKRKFCKAFLVLSQLFFLNCVLHCICIAYCSIQRYICTGVYRQMFFELFYYMLFDCAEWIELFGFALTHWRRPGARNVSY